MCKSEGDFAQREIFSRGAIGLVLAQNVRVVATCVQSLHLLQQRGTKKHSLACYLTSSRHKCFDGDGPSTAVLSLVEKRETSTKDSVGKHATSFGKKMMYDGLFLSFRITTAKK